jgi:hypothetical protein
MATQPIPPDRINPMSPPELPPDPAPDETPMREPPGFEPVEPDHDNPDPDIPGIAPPPD